MTARPATALALLALAGCAGATSSPPEPAQKPIFTEGGFMNTTTSGGTDVVIKAAPADVWRVLPLAYADLGVEVKTRDDATRRMGNMQANMVRQLKGEPLSKYFNCGTVATGPAADSYRLTVRIVSQVVPKGEGTLLTTEVFAEARDISGTSTAPVSCGSLGALERRLHTLVQQKLIG